MLKQYRDGIGVNLKGVFMLKSDVYFLKICIFFILKNMKYEKKRKNNLYCKLILYFFFYNMMFIF